MEEADRLIETEVDFTKLSLLGILNLGFRMEYSFVVDYPRLIDRLVVEKKINKEAEVVKTLARLGMDSIKHADWEAELTRELGGEPEFGFELEEEPLSTEAWCIRQLAREMFALSLYQHGRGAAERSLARGAWARLSSWLSGRGGGETSRKAIDIFGKLIVAEKAHTELLRKALSELHILEAE